jgi:hypothetical protein
VFSTVPLALFAYFGIFFITLMLIYREHHQHSLRNVEFVTAGAMRKVLVAVDDITYVKQLSKTCMLQLDL